MEQDSFADAYDLVLGILTGLSGDAHLTDFVAAPPHHYTIRIDLRGEIGKTLIVSRYTVDRAPVNRAAFRSLELLLQSAVLRQRSYRAIDKGRTAAGLTAPPAETRVLAQECEVCGEPITLNDPLAVQYARRLHRRCLAQRSA